MKQKSYPQPGIAFLKLHAFALAVFTIGIGYYISFMMRSPYIPSLNLEDFKRLIFETVMLNVYFAISFLVHLGVYQIRVWRATFTPYF